MRGVAVAVLVAVEPLVGVEVVAGPLVLGAFVAAAAAWNMSVRLPSKVLLSSTLPPSSLVRCTAMPL